MAQAVIDELRGHAVETVQWLRNRVVEKTGIRIMRQSIYLEQERAAFSLGREIGQEEGKAARPPRRKSGPRPTHLHVVL